jgi:hypothetical protein
MSVSAQISQNTTLDLIAAGELRAKVVRTIPLSLKPDERVSYGCVLNNPVAIEIRDAWKPNNRVTVMAAEEFDALIERCHTDFHGQEKDIDDSASLVAECELEAEFNG